MQCQNVIDLRYNPFIFLKQNPIHTILFKIQNTILLFKFSLYTIQITT